MKVFIVMDTTENTGRESIIGVFESLEKAKITLADYVLNTEANMIEPCNVNIAEFEVEKTDEKDLYSVADVAEAFRKALGDKSEEEKTIAEKLYEVSKKYSLLLNVDYEYGRMKNGDPVPMSAELTIAYVDEIFFSVRLDEEKDWYFIDNALEKIPDPIAKELKEICTAYGETLIKNRGDLFSFFN